MFNNGDSARPVRVALYARVSSEEQRENQTIKTQLHTADKWLELQEMMEAQLILHDRYLDDGVSSASPKATGLSSACPLAIASASITRHMGLVTSRPMLTMLVLCGMSRLGTPLISSSCKTMV